MLNLHAENTPTKAILGILDWYKNRLLGHSAPCPKTDWWLMSAYVPACCIPASVFCKQTCLWSATPPPTPYHFVSYAQAVTVQLLYILHILIPRPAEDSVSNKRCDPAQLSVSKDWSSNIMMEILLWFHYAEHNIELKVHLQERQSVTQVSFWRLQCKWSRNPNECRTTLGSAVINITISPLLPPAFWFMLQLKSQNSISNCTQANSPEKKKPAPTFPPVSHIFSCSRSVITAKINQSYNNSRVLRACVYTRAVTGGEGLTFCRAQELLSRKMHKTWSCSHTEKMDLKLQS